MGEKSAIQWTEATWTIVQGCDPVSQGCVDCYVVPLLWRMQHNPDSKIADPIQGVIEKHVNRAGESILRFTGKVVCRDDRLDWPLKWKRPRMIFVPSHGDIFHKKVPDTFLDRIFEMMERADWHTYQVLTKRSKRMRDYVNARYAHRAGAFPHMWFGVSCEDQPNLDERAPDLIDTNCKVRFISREPGLGAVELDLREDHCDLCGGTGILARWPKGKCHICGGRGTVTIYGKPRRDGYRTIDWLIDGGESGDDARPFDLDASRHLERQCVGGGIVYFRKQLGRRPFEREPSRWPNGYPHGNRSVSLMPDGFGRYYVTGLKHKQGGDPSEWPEDLRRREFPTTPETKRSAA